MIIPDAEVLARSPLFAELGDAELRALARVAVRRTLQQGEALFFAGDEAQGLHIVISGRMKVFVVSPGSGREVILTVDRPYNAVAELVALDGGTYPANAEALEETELLVDRKSTRLNSSHVASSYAVFCLKKKNSSRE